MPTPARSNYEKTLQRLVNAVVALSPLSDVTDSSSLKHMLASFAREVDEAHFQIGNMQDLFSIDTASGTDLDERAKEIQPALVSRKQATKASGFVQFGRTGTAGTVTIPVGTVVKTGDGVAFSTTATGTIAAGNTTSADVPVVAVVAGADGNVLAGTIVKFDNKPVGVGTVTNTAPTQFGSDTESDDEFRSRIKSFIATLARCTPEALEYVAKTVSLPTGQRVTFAKAVEDLVNRGEVTLYIDDGQGTAESFEPVPIVEIMTEGLAGPPPDAAVGGEERLSLKRTPVRRLSGFTIQSTGTPGRGVLVEGTHFTLNEASGQVIFNPPLVAGEIITAIYTPFTGLIAEVQKTIDGDPNDRLNYPGWRAAGVRVLTATPQILIQQVTASLVVKTGYNEASVQSDVKNALLDYINSRGISGDIIVNRLVEVMMAVDGVENLTLTDPASDVILLDDQLPRTTTGNLNIT